MLTHDTMEDRKVAELILLLNSFKLKFDQVVFKFGMFLSIYDVQFHEMVYFILHNRALDGYHCPFS